MRALEGWIGVYQVNGVVGGIAEEPTYGKAWKNEGRGGGILQSRHGWGTVWIMGEKAGKLDKLNYENLVYYVKELLFYSIGTERWGAPVSLEHFYVTCTSLPMSGLNQLHALYQAEVLGNILYSYEDGDKVLALGKGDLILNPESITYLELGSTHWTSPPLSFPIHKMGPMMATLALPTSWDYCEDWLKKCVRNCPCRTKLCVWQGVGRRRGG